LDNSSSAVVLWLQEIDSVEYGLTDIQEYYANTGALVAAAKNARQGKDVGCRCDMMTGGRVLGTVCCCVNLLVVLGVNAGVGSSSKECTAGQGRMMQVRHEICHLVHTHIRGEGGFKGGIKHWVLVAAAKNTQQSNDVGCRCGFVTQRKMVTSDMKV
jgi:hypothetical protein